MPPTRPATIFCLRCWVTAKLTVGAARLDAEVGGVVDVAIHGSGFQERLGRDASTVETGAPEGRILLHERRLQARRSGIEDSGVAARATTDHHEVELLSHAPSHGSAA